MCVCVNDFIERFYALNDFTTVKLCFAVVCVDQLFWFFVFCCFYFTNKIVHFFFLVRNSPVLDFAHHYRRMKSAFVVIAVELVEYWMMALQCHLEHHVNYLVAGIAVVHRL